MPTLPSGISGLPSALSAGMNRERRLCGNIRRVGDWFGRQPWHQLGYPMFVIAGGILPALFIIMMLIGLAATIRDIVRAVKRNAGSIAMFVVALAVIVGAGVLFAGIGSILPIKRSASRPPAPNVSHVLFHAPQGYERPGAMGYYDGDRFVCVDGCG
jgi:hypothetical protein